MFHHLTPQLLTTVQAAPPTQIATTHHLAQIKIAMAHRNRRIAAHNS